MRRAGGRISFRCLYLRGLQVVLRALVQQPRLDRRMQKQRRVRHQQKEPHRVQSVPPPQVPPRRHVEERVALRPPLQLVQDPLPPPRTAAAATAAAAAAAIRQQLDAIAAQAAPKAPLRPPAPPPPPVAQPLAAQPALRARPPPHAPHRQDERGAPPARPRRVQDLAVGQLARVPQLGLFGGGERRAPPPALPRPARLPAAARAPLPARLPPALPRPAPPPHQQQHAAAQPQHGRRRGVQQARVPRRRAAVAALAHAGGARARPGGPHRPEHEGGERAGRHAGERGVRLDGAREGRQRGGRGERLRLGARPQEAQDGAPHAARPHARRQGVGRGRRATRTVFDSTNLQTEVDDDGGDGGRGGISGRVYAIKAPSPLYRSIKGGRLKFQ